MTCGRLCQQKGAPALAQSSEHPTLVVVGAGPKATALAAKTAVLRSLGWSTPRLVVIDRTEVAAHWSGKHGYTDGRHALGTSPEKDVGYPYASTAWGSAGESINHRMRQYSWQSFLIDEGRYSSWVDRGRPQPSHSRWASYLRWVARTSNVELHIAHIDRITTHDGRWRVHCVTPTTGASSVVEGDGLVMTGPGTPRVMANQPVGHPRVLDGASYWTCIEQFERRAEKGPWSVCVIGAGETAAAVTVSLLEIFRSQANIQVVSRQGVIYSRGESFDENRLFSHPWPEWPRLSEQHRFHFMKRTDRGVFSVQAKRIMDAAENVESLPGEVKRIEASDFGVSVKIEHSDTTETFAFDYVIAATSFRPLWFSELFDLRTRERVASALEMPPGGQGADALQSWVDEAAFPREGMERQVEDLVARTITTDLSIDGLVPRLHLPMLAGLNQGPGFPNLSSLGLVSDRILRTYVSEGGRSPTDTGRHAP